MLNFVFLSQRIFTLYKNSPVFDIISSFRLFSNLTWANSESVFEGAFERYFNLKFLVVSHIKIICCRLSRPLQSGHTFWGYKPRLFFSLKIPNLAQLKPIITFFEFKNMCCAVPQVVFKFI